VTRSTWGRRTLRVVDMRPSEGGDDPMLLVEAAYRRVLAEQPLE
jgi:hypothetical protein